MYLKCIPYHKKYLNTFTQKLCDEVPSKYLKLILFTRVDILKRYGMTISFKNV